MYNYYLLLFCFYHAVSRILLTCRYVSTTQFLDLCQCNILQIIHMTAKLFSLVLGAPGARFIKLLDRYMSV